MRWSTIVRLAHRLSHGLTHRLGLISLWGSVIDTCNLLMSDKQLLSLLRSMMMVMVMAVVRRVAVMMVMVILLDDNYVGSSASDAAHTYPYDGREYEN